MTFKTAVYIHLFFDGNFGKEYNRVMCQRLSSRKVHHVDVNLGAGTSMGRSGGGRGKHADSPMGGACEASSKGTLAGAIPHDIYIRMNTFKE